MRKKSFEILKAGLVVGTLDILSAFLYYFIKTGNKNVFNVLKYVAGGLFGKDSYLGSNGRILAGLLLHYIIAMLFTILLFWIFPKLQLFSTNKILTGIGYGVFVWTVMNLIVVPLSNIGKRPFNTGDVLINMLILIVCMGIPLSIWANKFYRKENPQLIKAEV